MDVITQTMLDGLQYVRDAERSLKNLPLGRRRWWALRRLHASTSKGLLARDLVTEVKRRRPDVPGVPWTEVDITPYGWGVLAGVRAQRRLA